MTQDQMSAPGWPCGRQRRTLTTLVMAAALTLSPIPGLAAPVDEEGALEDSSVLFAAAQSKLDAGDHDGAVKLLEEGLARIPEGPGYAPTRALMLLKIVEALEGGFAEDRDLERLRRAKRLLDRYLGALDLLDEQGRGGVEERRSVLIGEIGRIEAEQRRADEERGIAARRERAEWARKQARSLTIAGSVTTSVGAAALVLMSVGLGIGRSADANINALAEQYKTTPLCKPDGAECTDRYDAFQDQLRRGNAANVMFVVAAAVGGTLLSSGSALLIVARKKNREARAFQVTSTPTASPSGFGFVVLGRF
jgi:hypothetical protein